MNAFGGRLDHTMANIETMFHITKLTNKPLYLMSEDSVACLLMPVNTGTSDFNLIFCPLPPPPFPLSPFPPFPLSPFPPFPHLPYCSD